MDAARSRQMALVRHKDTKPELRVRRFLHSCGLRYRLHDKTLPGRPDLVFPARRVVVFVHGCFWHRHADPACQLARMPKSRLEVWRPKLEGNAARDRRDIAALEAAGWTVLVVWECQSRDAGRLAALARDVASHPPAQPRRMHRRVP
jgi:DNA mismatch endonuclease (patch repair protein)